MQVYNCSILSFKETTHGSWVSAKRTIISASAVPIAACVEQRQDLLPLCVLAVSLEHWVESGKCRGEAWPENSVCMCVCVCVCVCVFVCVCV